ncbi:MAG: class I SAM-dependent methyltransferase [Pyrinomonadaceae bacterium]
MEMTNDVEYAGKDLEAMSFAVNYHRWILDEFRPFLGKRIVEVGAGSGSFSEMLLAETPDVLAVVEPSKMFDPLENGLSAIDASTKVEYYNSIFSSVHMQIRESIAPDSIIYVNVLEHIEKDSEEIMLAYESLSSGGRLFIFVPALMSLYGKFDELIGHYRRYSKRGIEEKCTRAGFKIIRSKYFDFAGIIPWWIKYKLLRSDSLQPGAVSIYDRLAVPIIRLGERLIPVPIGKNVLLIAEK